MGLMREDALLIAIEEDARLQGERLVAEARESAAGILEAAEKEVSEERGVRTAALAEELRRKTSFAVNSARSRAGGRMLSVRHEMAGEVLRRVEEAVRKLPRERYAGLLGRFYGELKKDWFEDKEPLKHIVLINPDDAGLINDPQAELRPDKSVSLGVVFASADGRLRYENTVPSRIKKARDTLMPMIDRILFGRD